MTPEPAWAEYARQRFPKARWLNAGNPQLAKMGDDLREIGFDQMRAVIDAMADRTNAASVTAASFRERALRAIVRPREVRGGGEYAIGWFVDLAPNSSMQRLARSGWTRESVISEASGIGAATAVREMSRHDQPPYARESVVWRAGLGPTGDIGDGGIQDDLESIDETELKGAAVEAERVCRMAGLALASGAGPVRDWPRFRRGMVWAAWKAAKERRDG